MTDQALSQPTPVAGVLKRFAEQVRRTPHARAAAGVDGTFTYAELDREASRIAALLDRHGVVAGARVGLAVERSAAAVAAIVGILRTGAAYVPLDPDSPVDRLAAIVEDSGVRHAVVSASARSRLPDGVAAVRLDQEVAGGRVPEPPIVPGDTAYVIYTSGSTGRPKGVVVSHANLAHLFAATGPELGLGPGDVWSCTHSFAFDFSVWEVWGALAHGGAVVVATREEARDPAHLSALLVREGVTVLSQTPRAYYLLGEHTRAACERGESSLRLVVFGGEALSWAKLAAYAPSRGRVPDVVNMYGITEGTVHVTAHRVAGDQVHTVAEGTIGRPLAFARCHVLDVAGEPVGTGVVGELFIGGMCVAQGYLNRTEETAARFLPDPFTSEGRLYRTGDLVSRDEHGLLRYHGRLDRQIKVRGHRVECGEVEAAFHRAPRVRGCVAVGEGDGLALYLAGDLGPGDRQQMITWARTVLPDYMVPTRLVLLDELPMTVNCKVDLDRLPELAARSARVPSASTGNPLEEQVLLIWRDALGHDDVGLDSRFSDVGGQSFAAIAVHRALTAAGHRTSVVDVYRYPTVRSLAAHLAGDDHSSTQADGHAERTYRRQESYERLSSARGRRD